MVDWNKIWTDQKKKNKEWDDSHPLMTAEMQSKQEKNDMIKNIMSNKELSMKDRIAKFKEVMKK